MKLQVTSLWQHLSWGGVSFTASIRQEKTWGANNSVYGGTSRIQWLLQRNSPVLSCDK